LVDFLFFYLSYLFHFFYTRWFLLGNKLWLINGQMNQYYNNLLNRHSLYFASVIPKLIFRQDSLSLSPDKTIIDTTFLHNKYTTQKIRISWFHMERCGDARDTRREV